MFVSHGEFKLELLSDYLVVEACGPFNEEAVHRYRDQLIALASQFPKSWGQLNIMHDNCLYTPQAERALNELTMLRTELGMCCVAFVIADKPEKMIMHQQLGAIYTQLQVKHAFFDRREPALVWLREQSQAVHREGN